MSRSGVSDYTTQPGLAPLWAAIASLGLVAAAGGIGSAATLPNIPDWYAGLSKPAFTPPNYVFGPAWTVLYVLMALAFFRVLTRPARAPFRISAVAWFVGQVVLNALWSVAFFGFRSPLVGLFVIAALIVGIVGTATAFWRIDRPAALLLIPYLLWVFFASALNLGVCLLNG
ncbi:TspO/MBR family protein [Asticcacaulis sp. YBE204]|uniref:TspO/MBR family protein n=1 Tax=Asticcacaulis sp. YBE204 TaxID=1282363 RepID=UPI0003C3B425|nr:TspO/MBR family protein [Asticcacaulis sp. YBE204]ESQ79436.1 hypothetical protein AEYBE204_10540 [Asticcacaulis sp. YBE204]